MHEAERPDALADRFDDNTHRVIARHVASVFERPWHRHYASGKLLFDPVYAAVAEHLLREPRALLDVGCGIGLLGLYLRERGYTADYRGIDFDAAKIALARRAGARCRVPLVFDGSEARALPRVSGHVVLLDVLHYLPADAQGTLLAECAARVAPGGLLIVRSVLRTRSWRFRMTVAEEYFLYASRWMKTPARHYPERADIEAPLHAAGFDMETAPLWGRTPFNSFLIVARRTR